MHGRDGRRVQIVTIKHVYFHKSENAFICALYHDN